MLVLHFRHGDKPEDASYAYVLLPGKDEMDMAQYAKSEAIEILSNTKYIQAVSDKKSGLSGINFWSSGSVNGIQVKSPCSVTRHDIETGSMFLGISDPTHKQKQIAVIMDGEYDFAGIHDEGITVQYVNGKTEIIVDTSKQDRALHYLRLEIKHGKLDF